MSGFVTDRAQRREGVVLVHPRHEDSTFTAGAGPGAFNAGSSSAITVTASGTITDKNVIEEALLSVYSNAAPLDFCGDDDAGRREAGCVAGPHGRPREQHEADQV